MIKEGDVVTAGVSGGADSVCLLFVLCALRETLGFEVQVCHVNHGLRGAEADADEAYVRELCAQLGVRCRIFHRNVELIARNRKQSPEEAGRTVRVEAFECMCREDGCTKIATAHHREDNAETVLLNAARGTGLKGLCGIWPVRGRWIRPLLFLTRGQIEAYLEEKGVQWCEDATNAGDAYTRNRIRHSVLPVLEDQINTGAVRHLDELSRQAREVWDYLEAGTDQAWKRCVTIQSGRMGSVSGQEEMRNTISGKMLEEEMRIAISGKAFAEEMPAVQNQLLMRCIARVRGGEKDISSVHIGAVNRLFCCQNGRSVHLPGGVRAERVYGGVEICRVPKGKPQETAGKSFRMQQEEAEETEVELAVPGVTEIPGTGKKICCRFVDGGNVTKAREIPQKSYTKWIDYDIIKFRLSVRNRRAGDYFTVDQKGSRKKLKNYLINEKIPREERERMPLIADGSHIVWIPGRRMSAAYQVRRETEKILELKIMEERENGRDNQSSDSGGESG